MESNVFSDNYLGILDNKYTILRLIGQGCTSQVYLATRNKDEQKVAIKIFKPSFLNKGSSARDIFKDELTALTILEHQHIVKMYDFGIEGKIIGDSTTLQDIWFIVLEYVSQQTLIDLLKEFYCLSEELAFQFFKQIYETIRFIQQKGICHRDIKLENMLLNDQYQLKITDFGFASFSKDSLKDQVGTQVYIAPEIILKKEYKGSQIDVFSMGVVLFALVCGMFPFKFAHPSDPYYKLIAEGKFEEFWKKYQKICNISEECKDLIQQMLAFNPEERISISEIENQDWYINNDAQMSVEEISKQINLMRQSRYKLLKAKKEQRNRGDLSGEIGSTPYIDNDIIHSNFEVNQEKFKIYNFDRKEVEVLPGIKINEIIDKIALFIEEINNKKKNQSWTYSFIENKQSKKKKNLILKNSGKKIVFTIGFIQYLSKEQEQDNMLMIKFEKIDGNMLYFYKYIEKIKIQIQEMIDYY